MGMSRGLVKNIFAAGGEGGERGGTFRLERGGDGGGENDIKSLGSILNMM